MRDNCFTSTWTSHRFTYDDVWFFCMCVSHYSLHWNSRYCSLLLLLLSRFSRATPETAAHQAPRSLGSSRQEHWSGYPFPPPEDLPNPGIKPSFPTLQVDSLLSEPPGKPWILEWVAYPYSRYHPDPGIKPGSPALQADSLPAELWIDNLIRVMGNIREEDSNENTKN